MRGALWGLLMAAACVYGGAVHATGAEQGQTVAAASSIFSRPVVLRGTLGDARIQMNVRPKTEFEGGIEGDYFVFGTSQKILLAGELEGPDMMAEESENGTDVSGQWEGKLNGDTLSGNWTSADGSVTKVFSVKVVKAAYGDDKAKQVKQATAGRAGQAKQ